MSKGAGESRISIGGSATGSILITGDGNVINGIAELPTNYGAYIREFIVKYTGTKDRPVPFGGRQKVIGELNRWLADPSALPYLFVGGPAGRGKSALLVRWLESVEAGEDPPAVVFVPVSIRFGTNLASTVFAALAARLAHLHGEQVPITGFNSADIWRGMVSDYLRRPLPDGRRLLVVLDGLDEAADWKADAGLFPLDPPRGLRVVVSARYQANEAGAESWLRRLGWEGNGLARVLDLSTLDSEGIRDVLQRMGFPLAELGQRVDIVSELYRLTEGDPLLVRLYVDDLWQRGVNAARLQPGDLHAIAPGYEGYFQKWWEDQRRLWGHQAPMREPEVQSLLNLLACALGPLRKEDLLELASEEGLNSWDLEEALHVLGRFVIGDGQEKGYAFQHPRLAEFFYSRLSKKERKAWEKRFLDWGERTLEALERGACEPAEVPPYLVRYYGAHRQRSGLSCRDLVCDGWRRAWEALEGVPSGFLSDVDRAWAQAEKARDIPMQIRCALCHASVRALSANIPPELLAMAVKEGLLTPAQGLAYVRQTPDSDQRASALRHLVPYLPEAMLSEVLGVAREIGNEKDRAHVLAMLVPHLPAGKRQEVLSEVLGVACEIGNEKDRAHVLAMLVPHLPAGKRQEVLLEVLGVAREIGNEKDRAHVLAMLVPHLPAGKRQEVLSEAFEIAREIENNDGRVRALAVLVPHLPAQKRQAVLKEALLAARDIKISIFRAEALAVLLPHLRDQERGEILLEAVGCLAKGFILGEFWTTDKSEFEWYYAGFFSTLGPFVQDDVSSVLLEESRKMEFKPARAKALAGLLPYLSKQKSDEVLPEAFEIAHGIEKHWYYGRFVSALTPFIPKQKRKSVLSKAIKVACKIEDELVRFYVLSNLKPYFSEFMLYEVLGDALEKGAEKYLAERMSALAPHLPPSLLTESLEIARKIKNESLRARVLSALVRYLPAPLLSEALVIAREINDAEARAIGLTALVSRLSGSKQRDVLSEVLKTVRDIENELSTVQILINLYPYLFFAENKKNVLGSLLYFVLANEDEFSRPWTVYFLALTLVREKRSEFLKRRGIIQENKKNHAFADEMGKLVPYSAEPSLSEALRMAFKISFSKEGGETSIRLVQHLFELRYERIMSEVLPIAIKFPVYLFEFEEEEVVEYRYNIIAKLVPFLQDWAKDQPEESWQAACSTLRELAKYPRPEFLKFLEALLPFYLEFVPESERQHTAEGIYHAIQDVCHWWP